MAIRKNPDGSITVGRIADTEVKKEAPTIPSEEVKEAPKKVSKTSRKK